MIVMHHICSVGPLLCVAPQVNGHFMAQLDPLGIDMRPVPVELDPALYGFTDKDLDRE